MTKAITINRKKLAATNGGSPLLRLQRVLRPVLIVSASIYLVRQTFGPNIFTEESKSNVSRVQAVAAPIINDQAATTPSRLLSLPLPLDRGVKVASLSPASCSALETGEKNPFDGIYERGTWGNKIMTIAAFYNNANWPPTKRSSSSGGGSNLGSETTTSLRLINEAIVQYNISSMIDMPCGDLNWIFDSWETDSLKVYLGLDIAKDVIALNQIRFAHHSNKLFRHWDGASCSLPKYHAPDGAAATSFELVHSRDVVQHLPQEMGLKFFCNIFQSGAKILITTTFPGAVNRNIRMGGAYKNNLAAPPFNFPVEGVKCEETHPAHESDSTCIYDLTQDWVHDYIKDNKCNFN
jgi:hypothetical protein